MTPRDWWRAFDGKWTLARLAEVLGKFAERNPDITPLDIRDALIDYHDNRQKYEAREQAFNDQMSAHIRELSEAGMLPHIPPGTLSTDGMTEGIDT